MGPSPRDGETRVGRHTPLAAERELPLVGAHVSTAGSLVECAARARRIGAEAVQVHPSNPRMWRRSTFGAVETAQFGAELAAHGIPLFVHTIYLINLASPDDDLREKSSASLADALFWGMLAGATAVVTHVGSHRGSGFEAGLARVVDALERTEVILQARTLELSTGSPNEIADLLPGGSQIPGPMPRLLIEGSAGAGDSLGRDADELGRLVRAAPFPIGICLDTAHLFAAGVPVHTPQGVARLLDDLGEGGCVDRVGLVHLNDSKTPFGSKSDRHENLWDGLLGRDGLLASMTEERLLTAPFVLEVPGAEGKGADNKNMRRARTLRTRAGVVRRSRGTA